MNINVARNGQQIGSFPLDEVNQRLASGALLPGDLGWQEGMGEWKPLHSLPGVHVPAGTSAVPPAATPPRASLGHAAAGGGSKQQYLAGLRSNTVYAAFRASVNVIAILLYIMAVLYGIAALGFGALALQTQGASGLAVMIGGLFGAAIVFVFATVLKGLGTILADLGDAAVERNSRS